MSRKHYKALSAAIKQIRSEGGYDSKTIDRLTQDLMSILKQENPLFDKDRFLEASL